MNEYLFYQKDVEGKPLIMKIYADDISNAISKYWHGNSLKDVTKIELKK